MTKNQFISFVRKDSKSNNSTLFLIFEEFIECIGTSLVDKKIVYLRGFGKFSPPRTRLKNSNRRFVWRPFKPYDSLLRKLSAQKSVFEIYLEE